MGTRNPTPEETGVLLYEHLRQEVSGSGILSLDRLRESFLRHPGRLGDHFEGEVMIGCMFAAVLAIEETSFSPVRESVRKGLEGEFIRHLREQGATDGHVDEWRVVLGEHFAEYFRSMERHTDPALPPALGREFLWNLTGVEEEDAVLIETLTVYLAATRVIARRILRQHIPIRQS